MSFVSLFAWFSSNSSQSEKNYRNQLGILNRKGMYIFFFFFFFLSLLVHFKVVQRYTLQFVRQWWIECKINDSIRRCTAVAYASLATATSFFFYSSYSIVSLFLTAAYFFFPPESDNFIVSSTLSTKRVKKKNERIYHKVRDELFIHI